MKLPTLYKLTKSGKTQQYDITVSGDSYTTSSGQVGGAFTTNTTVCLPKNVGRSNSTTAEEQAISEATSKHTSKIKSGYTTSIEDDSTVLLPQKISRYQDHMDKVQFPCYVTPKLNGVNGEFRLKDGILTLHSRGGGLYPMIDHLKDEVIKLMTYLDVDSIAGEIYKHGWHLQDITAAVKSFRPNTHDYPTSALSFYVFELPTLPGTYQQKQDYLTSAVPILSDLVHVQRLKSVLIDSHYVVTTYHAATVASGYEGVVIYNSDSIYKYGERSLSVFKYKIPLDGEYKIVSYVTDKRGHPTLICEIPSGATFKVRPTGDAASRELMLTSIDSYIGSWYKIEYETLSKSGIPLKPIGIGLRDCDISGNPLT